MAFPDDLLEQAHYLACRESKRPKQASLRRAVSTAYYALFHLLIAEAVANWKRADQRSDLSRAFAHGTMKTASLRVIAGEYPNHNPRIVKDLKEVAFNFKQLQQDRLTADYDNSRRWSRKEVVDKINLAEQAFRIWRSIREEDLSQDYLLALLVKDRP